MKRLDFIPGKAIGQFSLEESIDKYLYLSYKKKHVERELYSYDDYYFLELDINIWVEDGIIKTIRCDKECYWMGENLIGMLYDKFLVLANQQPTSEDICYVPVSRDRGQNQKVYDFENLSLQLWVWRKKIRTVLTFNYED